LKNSRWILLVALGVLAVLVTAFAWSGLSLKDMWLAARH
jgi:hypothetical protein